DELRDLPDVFRVLGALSALEGAGVRSGGRLPGGADQPLHPRGGADPLRPVRAVQRDRGRGGGVLLRALLRAGGAGLRPAAGPDWPGPAAGLAGAALSSSAETPPAARGR